MLKQTQASTGPNRPVPVLGAARPRNVTSQRRRTHRRLGFRVQRRESRLLRGVQLPEQIRVRFREARAVRLIAAAAVRVQPGVRRHRRHRPQRLAAHTSHPIYPHSGLAMHVPFVSRLSRHPRKLRTKPRGKRRPALLVLVLVPGAHPAERVVGLGAGKRVPL